jgi:hypothetical protein
VTKLREIQEALVNALNSSAGSDSGKEADSALLLKHLDRQRLKIYSNDIFQRRLKVASNCFALTMRLIGKDGEIIVEKYWQEYPSKMSNPNFEMDRFPEFLRKQSELMSKHPYISDLASYEWMRRRCITNAERSRFKGSEFSGDISKHKKKRARLNHTLELQSFEYPVHSIAGALASNRKKKSAYSKGMYFMAIYQDPSKGSHLCAQELGELTYVVVKEIQDSGDTLEQTLKKTNALMPDLTPQETAEELNSLLMHLQKCGMLAGIE